jgi:hypothetical protein
MSDTSRTATPATSPPGSTDTGPASIPQPPAEAVLLASAARALAPSAVHIRTHRSPSGQYLAIVTDAHGAPLPLSRQDRITLGRWLGTAFPLVDWAEPHIFDLALGRLVTTAGAAWTAPR